LFNDGIPNFVLSRKSSERRQKSISVELTFATVFAFKHHVSVVKSTITYAAETWCSKAKTVAKVDSTETDFW
jgi:hypothetical protein